MFLMSTQKVVRIVLVTAFTLPLVLVGCTDDKKPIGQNITAPDNAPDLNENMDYIRDDNYADQCENPVSLDIEEGYKAIELVDLITGEQGEYELQKIHVFYNGVDAEDGSQSYILGLGEEYRDDEVEGKKELKIKEGVEVLCHNSQEYMNIVEVEEIIDGEKRKVRKEIKGNNSVRANMDIQNSFSTLDGRTRKYRKFKFRAKNGLSSAVSELYNREEQIKFEPEEMKQENLDYVVTQSDDLKKVNVKIRFITEDNEGNSMIFWVQSEYELNTLED